VTRGEGPHLHPIIGDTQMAEQVTKKSERKPQIGDDVLYSLGDASANRGEARAAKIVYVHDLSAKSADDQARNPGLVNIAVFIGRDNDFPAQKDHPERAIWPLKGITFDASKKMGTWHYKD